MPQMTWMRKSTAMMAPRDMRLKEASTGDRRAIADADQAGQLDTSGETRTAITSRTPGPPTDAARMGTQRDTRSIQRLAPTLCCESRTKFSADELCVNKTADTLPKFQYGLHVHSNSGREQNSAMHYIRGNAQWSGGQLRVRSARWL